MSKRKEPVQKRTVDVLEDVRTGHRQASFDGPQAARKYLERVFAGQHSLPNAVKFFAYDLLADACAQCGDAERRDEAIALARENAAAAEADTPREFKAYLPSIRMYEVGIAGAVDDGRFDDALALCGEAVTLGLGRVYEQKADTIRRMQ